MDNSSLAEAQQSDQQQAYDPAQAQAYAAYYAACDQYYAASAYYHQPYYPHDYSSTAATAATAGVYYAEAQPDSAVPQADAAQIHHPASHGMPYAPAAEQAGYSYQASAGLNTAAAAALSQISQLTGSIDAAERMMAAGMHNTPQSSHYQQYSHPMTMQHGAPSIRPGAGGTPRGGGPPRGRGRGRIGQHPSVRDGVGPPPSRGRGFGRMSRGRGRRPPQFALNSQQQQTEIAPKAPQKSLLPVAWCDICRVDCNSIEILEQHKNGKRHKRTVQRIQEIQAQQKLISTELQSNAAAKPVLFIQGEVGNPLTNEVKNAVLQESTEGFVATEINQQQMGQSVPVSDIANSGGLLTDALQDETLPMDGLSKKRKISGYDKWSGSKQKMMRIGRGGKHFKSFDRTHNRPFERPKDRPRDRPRVCTVCNVMCDTMAVFECHLSGKKHISRIKRFEGHGSVYGPISVYIPPNQPSAYPNKGPEPLFYGLQTLETLQQGGHGVFPQQMESVTAQVEGFEEGEGVATESVDKQNLGNVEVGPATDAINEERVDAINEERVAAKLDIDERSSLNDPDAGETNNSAPCDDDSMNITILPAVVDVAALDYEASKESEIVVPGLNANSEDPLPRGE